MIRPKTEATKKLARALQETKQHFIIQIVPREEYDDGLFLQLKSRFIKGFNEPVTIDIEVVDAIPRSGKLRRVVSKCLPREKFLFS